jgi:hypothetical protein
VRIAKYSAKYYAKISAAIKARIETAKERGTPLLDIERTCEEQSKIVSAISQASVLSSLGPHATLHIFTTARPLIGDDWSAVERKAWTEAMQALCHTPTLRVEQGGILSTISSKEAKRIFKLELLAMGDRADQLSGPANNGCIEGGIIKQYVEAGNLLAAAGGGRILNRSAEAPGITMLDGDGALLRGRLATVWALIIAEGWERFRSEDAPLVLVDGPLDNLSVHTMCLDAPEPPILLKPCAERDMPGVGARPEAGASMLSAAAAIGVRDSGDAWRLSGETSQEMFKRWQGTRQVYEPLARNLLLPPVPDVYAGVRELAVQGLIELVTEPDVKLWRALSLAEATTMRAAEATGASMAKAFARPLVNKVRTAAEWAAVMVRHVEHGSFEVSDCVSWTTSSSVAVRLANTAVVGGGRVVCMAAEALRGNGVLVRIGGSKLLEHDAITRSVAYAKSLGEVLLLTEQGIDEHVVVYEMGKVVGFLGEASLETEWDDVIDKSTVVCCTGVGTELSATQLEALEALGGHFSKLMTTKMTVLISALVGVSGHKKSRFAKEQGLPIVSLPRFAEALAAAGAAAWGAAAMPSF